MHADALPPLPPRDEGWGLPIVLAVAVHVLVALVFIVAWLWSPQRHVEPAAGDPSLEASVELSAAEARVARQALRETPVPAPAEPTPLPEAPEDTVPPPQPLPEPRPQDAPTPQQSVAQERIAQPDTVDQERVSAMAIAEEKAKQEQEAKKRQEQIDLTEQKRQEEAQQRQRLAKQQEEADRQKKLAEEQAQQAEREQKLAQIRKQREQAQREAQLAEQKLRQLADARAKASAASTTSAPQTTAGQGGTNTDLSAQYAAAIQQAVLAQWLRPDSVPLGQSCTINIRQLPGGQVVEAKVAASCPYDEAGRRSIEAAVLRAQPLPYRGFESVFQRNLIFHFTAQDR